MNGRSLLARARGWYHQEATSYHYCCAVEQILETAPPLLPGLQVMRCTRENLAQLQQRIPQFPDVVAHRVLHGHLGILAVSRTEWVFRTVAILGPQIYPVTGYPLQLTAQDAYLECTETVPGWRCKGVASGMMRYAAEMLRDHGVITVHLIIDMQNIASCRAAEHGGAQRVGQLICQRRLGRWQSEYLTGVDQDSILNTDVL